MNTMSTTRNTSAFKAVSLIGSILVTALLIGSQLGIANDYVAQADAMAVAKAQTTLAQKAAAKPATRAPG